MSLFGRQVYVEIGPAGGVGRQIRDLKTTFKIEMSRTATPNTGKIEIFNLSPASVALLEEPDVIVRLLVGYDVPLLVFQGSPIPGGVRSERRGRDGILTIEAADGGREWRESFVSISYSTETTFGEVLTMLEAELGAPRGSVRFEAGAERISQGGVFVGQVADVLTNLLTSAGHEWSIRDGALVIMPAGGDTGETAQVFSSAAGNLIGSPIPKPGGIEIVALLAPSIRPGMPFEVQSRDYSGLYISHDVTFEGDSHEGAFYTRIFGVPRS